MRSDARIGRSMTALGLERADRNSGRAQRARSGCVILGRLVLRQRHIRYVELDDRLHAIVNLGGGNDASTGVAYQGGASYEGLSGVPHVVNGQDAPSFQLLLIEAAQCLAGLRIV